MTPQTAAPFETLGTSHVAMLALFVLGIWPVFALGRHFRGRPEALRVSRAFALLIPCCTIPLQVIDFLPGNYNLQTTLPLQLCDFAWIAAVVALWTHRPTAVGLTYYWGLALTTQALITPALNLDFPDPKFVAYWGMHLLIVWAAIFLTFGLGLHPTWREFRRAVAITAAWAVTVFGVNLALGTNYGFLNRKPETSILDLLGPWPMYVVVEVAVVAAVWALMTWPWERSAARAGEYSPV